MSPIDDGIPSPRAPRRGPTRRAFLATCVTPFLSRYLHGCGSGGLEPIQRGGDPRLTARPGVPSQGLAPGESPLGLSGQRDGLLFVPGDYESDTPTPLLVMLHGAGGTARGLDGFGTLADEFGTIILIPESRGSTWDVLRGGYGPDVRFIDRALEHTFLRTRIDPSRIALGGFSDGASYALSLGVSNGDLFTHLVAFSPGFLSPADPIVGRPRVFVSHGANDSVLPVSASREAIVPTLKEAGYDVRYEEFAGGHTIPRSIADLAMEWFLA